MQTSIAPNSSLQSFAQVIYKQDLMKFAIKIFFSSLPPESDYLANTSCL